MGRQTEGPWLTGCRRSAPVGGTVATAVTEQLLHAASAVRVQGLGRHRHGRLAGSGVIAVIAVTAFSVRLWIALRGGGIQGTYGYDDGVYYAAASSFLEGRLPYRDFVLLHPPGIMLALTPFALLGRMTHDHVGFQAARVAWMLLGALNATLVVRLCRREGRAAAIAGGLLYALWTPVARTETTIRLEPLVTLGLLVALTLLGRPGATSSRRVLLWAGAALALSTSVKIWAVAPALLIVVWLWRRAGTKAAGWLALGGLLGGAVVDGPFLLAARARMVRMVVLDQLGRGRTLVDTPARAAHVLVPVGGIPDQWSPGPVVLAAALVALVLVAAVVLGRAGGRFALSLLGVELLVLLFSPSFFRYYEAFAGPGLALVVASIAAWLGDLPLRRLFFAPGGVRRALVAVPLALGILAATAGSLFADSRDVMSGRFPARSLERSVSASRCVTSDSPDALILTDVFSRDLHRGCQVPVDLSGLTYDRDALPLRGDGTAVPRDRNGRWQRDLGRYLFSGQSIFVLRAGDDGSNGSAVHRLDVLPVLARGQAFTLLDNPSLRSVRQTR